MRAGADLGETVAALLTAALELYRDSPEATTWLRHHLRRLDEPLRVAVAGPPRSGRSTLVDAIAADQEIRLVETGEDGPELRDADAVLYLARHRYGAELPGLSALHDHPVGRATGPVNTVLVLCRADEVGAGRADALSSARQAARRWCRDVRMGELCQDVVALAGRLARAGLTLRDSEFAALTALGRVPRADLEDHLLSVDRFVGAEFPVRLDPERRAALLDRFGVVGLRLCTTLIRSGYDTPAGLAAQLVRRSGLEEVRESVRRNVTSRPGALKARSALVALDAVLRREPRPQARGLAADVERVVASAHEFRELRLLAALRGGRVGLPAELAEEAQRLVGGHGVELLARLGVPDAAESDGHNAVFDALRRWQDHAENPVFSARQRAAARIVVRSCTGMVGMLPRPAPAVRPRAM